MQTSLICVWLWMDRRAIDQLQRGGNIGIDLNELVPIEFELSKDEVQELANGASFAGGNNVIIGLVLL